MGIITAIYSNKDFLEIVYIQQQFSFMSSVFKKSELGTSLQRFSIAHGTIIVAT